MAAPPFKVKAVYDYQSVEEDDLKFHGGQLIIVTEEVDEDWYSGEYVDAAGTKHEGLFPKNHVEKIEPSIPSRPARTRPKSVVVPTVAPFEAQQAALSSSKEDDKPIQDEAAETSLLQNPPLVPMPTVPTTQRPPSPKPSQPKTLAKTPAVSTPKSPPPAAPKPKSSSFKDRIAAFNKAAAPPIAPFKPSNMSSTSGFVKKPFVAPPPSRNAYVPIRRDAPQQVYRREEDPEITKHRESEPVEPAVRATDEPEQTPMQKPTSLKDRIALLQKQQLEAAARQAEAVHKKKPKRPPQRYTESEETAASAPGGEDAGDATIANDGSVTEHAAISPQATGQESIKSGHQVPREFPSDPNDADNSNGDTDAAEDLSPDDKSRTASGSVKQETEGGDEASEEEEIDPEIKRRMELRERMAKMSGGMGMMGMFGAPGGLPPMRKQKTSSESARRKSEDTEPVVRAPPIPIMPLPGMQKSVPAALAEEEAEPETASDNDEAEQPLASAGNVDDDASKVASSAPARRNSQRAPPPPIPTYLGPKDSPAPQLPDVPSPPLVPRNRPSPPASPESRPTPPPPPSIPPMTSGGEMSDDEMSMNRIASDDEYGHRSEKSIPLPPVSTVVPVPPEREDVSSPLPWTTPTTMSPSSPVYQNRRSSRIPPIPDTSSHTSSPSISRIPPPPPQAPPRRQSTTTVGSSRSAPRRQVPEPSEEEGTEYEGDYDTDIAPGADHKDALKAHARDSSLEESTTLGDTPVDSPRSPAPAAPSRSSIAVPRGIPPPPPAQPPKPGRLSVDMGRPPPPPVPAPKSPTMDDDEYDPFKYTAQPNSGASLPPFRSPVAEQSQFKQTPQEESPEEEEDEEEAYDAHERHVSLPPPPPLPSQTAPPPPPAAAPSTYGSVQAPTSAAPQLPMHKQLQRRSIDARQSLDTQGSFMASRRSMETSRTTGDQGFMAHDLDLASETRWWMQAKKVPPTIVNRTDILYEVEEQADASTNTTSKQVYVLFMDYSQTIITARYPTDNPANATLSQQHIPPPAAPREDQLETAHSRYGAKLITAATAKKDSTVGDGTSRSLILELLEKLPGALYPVGPRAYGALVYTNRANASFQQYDSIRAGDVVTFRNAKFQGHRGPVHQKYSIEVGKPDHVGVVVDWDGTKKKIRAWEQGRDEKGKSKVRCESYKVSDMRSGEVKVWRVMGREWIGWEGEN